MKKQIVIAVNPRSGVNRHKHIELAADAYLDKKLIAYKIVKTEYPGHIKEIAEDCIAQGMDALIVAGGDGSVNEAAQILVHSPVAIGIIPMGSGNGLARHLGIALNPASAFKNINQFNIVLIDTGKLNDRIFVSNTGLGFVSRVVETFNKSNERGFVGYSLNTIVNYFQFKPDYYNIRFDDDSTVDGHFFMLNICNSNQFGYRAKIAPLASLTDGLLDIVLIEKAPLHAFPVLLTQMFLGQLKPERNVIMRRTKNIHIKSVHPCMLQVDGESMGKHTQVSAEVLPLSLKVIVPGHVQ